MSGELPYLQLSGNLPDAPEYIMPLLGTDGGFRRNVLLAPGRGWTLRKTGPRAWNDPAMGVGVSGSRQFDGVDQRFALASAPVIGTSDFWLSFWLYQAAYASPGYIFMTGATGTGAVGFMLYQSSSTTMRMAIVTSGNSARVPATPAGSMIQGEWRHYIINWDRDDVATMYTNNVALSTTLDLTGYQDSLTHSNTGCIGANTVGANPFNGRLAGIGFGLGLLNEDERAELYGNHRCLYYEDLSPSLQSRCVHFWNGKDVVGASLVDAKGSNDGTAAGTSTTIAAAAGPNEELVRDLSGTYRGNIKNGSAAATWSTDVPSKASYFRGYSLALDGTDDYVELTNRDLAGAFTLSGWYKPASLASAAMLFGDTADTNADGVQIDATTGKVSLTVGGSNTVISTTGLTADAWNHVSVVRAATTNAIAVYLNGEDDTAGTPTVAGTLGVKALGATHSTPANFANGCIVDFRVYEEALSAADIAELVLGRGTTATAASRWLSGEAPLSNVGSTGDAVALVQSQDTGLGLFAQATATLRPTLSAGASGRRALSFGGTQYLEMLSRAVSEDVGRVFVVAKQTSAAQQTAFSQADKDAADVLLSLGASAGGTLEARQNESGGTEDRLTGDTVFDDGWHIFEYGSTGTGIEAVVDGVAQTLTVATGANNGDWGADVAADSTVLGGLLTSAGFASGWVGEIAEVVSYDIYLDAKNAAQIRRYLAKKYGITIA